MTPTSDELLKSVTKVLTRVPKKTLKNLFVKHTATGNADMKAVPADWKCFIAAYEEFKKSFEATVSNDPELQRIFVQMAVVSTLMGQINPDADETGLYAGLALFVAGWSERLGKKFFPECSPASFFALWSPFLNTFGVDWRFHGSSEVVLISLVEQIDGEPYALVFPGVSPTEDGKWSSFHRSLSADFQKAFSGIFGASGLVSSKQTYYYNPADESLSPRRKGDACWAIDVLRGSPDVEEFEKEEEEDTKPFDDEIQRLKSLIGKPK